MIPFNKPFMTGRELEYIQQAHSNGHLAGDGDFTLKCHAWLEQRTGAQRALLTHSCTAALEMAALLLDVAPGDEVIMPSYTFVSTANAFVLRGAVPVFVDVRPDTLNLDERLVEPALTPRTRAIVPVHYAGVGCEMDTILDVAKRHEIAVVEDAAQALGASYRGRALGTLGALGALSFHETKNVISGEGGALLINDGSLVQRAEIIREKGTDRSRYFRGEVDKYTWQDVGSSFLPSELVAAFLWAQLEREKEITSRRLAMWNRYHSRLEALEVEGLLQRPHVPPGCEHNAHMYYIVIRRAEERDRVLESLKQLGVRTVFHYVPLHSSPAGRRHGRTDRPLSHTDSISGRLLRLPLWLGLSDSDVDQIADSVRRVLIGI